MLKTEIKNIDTPLGKVQIKLCDLKDEKRIYPEYNLVSYTHLTAADE